MCKHSVNNSPSREVNAEDDLKTTILNLSKQTQEWKQERLSTSFQHHRFYSNPNPLGLQYDLPKSYHSHSRITKHLRSQAYTKKTKCCSDISSPSYDFQISSNDLHQMKNITVFMIKEYTFWLQTAKKVSTTLINLTINIKS